MKKENKVTDQELENFPEDPQDALVCDSCQ